MTESCKSSSGRCQQRLGGDGRKHLQIDYRTAIAPASTPTTTAKPAQIEPTLALRAPLDLEALVVGDEPAALELAVLDTVTVLVFANDTLVIKLVYLPVPVPTTVTVE